MRRSRMLCIPVVLYFKMWLSLKNKLVKSSGNHRNTERTSMFFDFSLR